MTGLPVSYGQVKATATLERVSRAEQRERGPRGKAPVRCFACHRAWFEAGVPAVARSTEAGITRWDCRCCGAYRLLSGTNVGSYEGVVK